MSIANKKKSIVLWAVVVLLVALSFVVAFGWYPALSVDGVWVYERDVWALRTAVTTFERASADDPALNQARLALPAGTSDAVIFERLVVNALVADAFNNGEGLDISKRVMLRDSAIANATTFAPSALFMLYGIPGDRALRLVVHPYIETEIIRNEYEHAGESFALWLEGRRASLDVRVYFSGLRWENGAFVEK